jgi:hypothetical protein
MGTQRHVGKSKDTKDTLNIARSRQHSSAFVPIAATHFKLVVRHLNAFMPCLGFPTCLSLAGKDALFVQEWNVRERGGL